MFTIRNDFVTKINFRFLQIKINVSDKPDISIIYILFIIIFLLNHLVV